MNDYIGEILSGVVASTVAYLFGRKKGSYEAQKLQGEALQTTQQVYDKLVSDVNQKFTELKDEITKLKGLVKEMEKELEECRKKTNEVAKRPKRKIIN